MRTEIEIFSRSPSLYLSLALPSTLTHSPLITAQLRQTVKQQQALHLACPIVLSQLIPIHIATISRSTPSFLSPLLFFPFFLYWADRHHCVPTAQSTPASTSSPVASVPTQSSATSRCAGTRKTPPFLLYPPHSSRNQETPLSTPPLDSSSLLLCSPLQLGLSPIPCCLLCAFDALLLYSVQGRRE